MPRAMPNIVSSVLIFLWVSVARVLEPLLENNIVIEKKIGKQIRSFSLNEEHKATKLLLTFYDELKRVLRD
jgi:hypothetical protein